MTEFELDCKEIRGLTHSALRTAISPKSFKIAGPRVAGVYAWSHRRLAGGIDGSVRRPSKLRTANLPICQNAKSKGFISFAVHGVERPEIEMGAMDSLSLV